jgi:hypothetical protein
MMFDAPPKIPLWVPPKPAIIRPAPPALIPPALAMPFLPGFRVYIPPAAATLIGITPSSTSGTNYTFSSASLGTPQGNSQVFVCVYIWSTGNQVLINSVSIDGTNGTIHVQSMGYYGVGSRTARVGIAARATSNTSGDIVVNASASSLGCAIAVYRVNNLKGGGGIDDFAAANSGLNASPSSPISSTLDTTATINNILILAGTLVDANPSSVSGATQDGSTTTYPTSTNIGRAWAGHDNGLAAQTNRSVSMTNGAHVAAIAAVTLH